MCTHFTVDVIKTLYVRSDDYEMCIIWMCYFSPYAEISMTSFTHSFNSELNSYNRGYKVLIILTKWLQHLKFSVLNERNKRFTSKFCILSDEKLIDSNKYSEVFNIYETTACMPRSKPWLYYT